jgi:hypothetical protein
MVTYLMSNDYATSIVGEVMQDELVMRALDLAWNAHGALDQRRKYTNEPYIVHPISVARLVLDYWDQYPDTAMVAAALCHDVLEDCPDFFNTRQIIRELGYEAFQYVKHLTSISTETDGCRSARKRLDAIALHFCDERTQAIKCCDIMDNVKNITQCDPEFAMTYLGEKYHTVNTYLTKLSKTAPGPRKDCLDRIPSISEMLARDLVVSPITGHDRLIDFDPSNHENAYIVWSSTYMAWFSVEEGCTRQITNAELFCNDSIDHGELAYKVYLADICWHDRTFSITNNEGEIEWNHF